MLEPLDQIWNRNHFKISGFVSEPPWTFQNHWNNAEPMQPLDHFRTTTGKYDKGGMKILKLEAWNFRTPSLVVLLFTNPGVMALASR